ACKSVKMLKIPMEAWSVKGISALASSLGKPIIMDKVTTRMCRIKNKNEHSINVEQTNQNEYNIVQNKRIKNVVFKQNRNHQSQNGYTGRQLNVGRNPKENTRKPNAGKYEFKKRMDEDPANADLRYKTHELLNEYNIVRKEEDSMLYQKAKVEWLNEEDRNTSLFIRFSRKGNIGAKLFLFVMKVGKDSNEMIKKVSDKEVKEALIDIEDDKAPGPDGFTSKFFKETWDTLGIEVCQAVQ
nr:hypothetical protein [Tanacetum cinerariifolium]